MSLIVFCKAPRKSKLQSRSITYTCLQGEITIFKKDERSRTDYLLFDSFNEETFLKYYLHLNQTGKFLYHKVAENGAIKIQVEFRASENTYPIFIHNKISKSKESDNKNLVKIALVPCNYYFLLGHFIAYKYLVQLIWTTNTNPHHFLSVYFFLKK